MHNKLFLHFIETEEELDKEKKNQLKKMVTDCAEEVSKLLDLDLVNIIIWPNKNAVIPETGEGGQAWSKELCFIYIDPTRPVDELKNIIKENIPATVYHELNHVAREKFLGKNKVGFYTNLNRAIISEGLASVFAKELFPSEKTPWTDYTDNEIRKLLNIYRERDVSKDDNYNHDCWFYGEGDLPRWIGYKIGYYLVSNFRKQKPNISWKDLIKMDAEKIDEGNAI